MPSTSSCCVRPGDYQNAADEFLTVLKEIEKATHLENPRSLVEWNFRKTYLRDLENLGISIIPTLWRDRLSAESDELDVFFSALETDELVIKPVISANADGTFRLSRDFSHTARQELARTFQSKECMIQPMMQSVVEEGEYSLFYLAGECSHAVLKTPKSGDFRVQEEHGGHIQAIAPEPLLKERADAAIAQVSPIHSTRAPIWCAPREGIFW